MRYSVHLGHRDEAYPSACAENSTREEAQKACTDALRGHPDPGVTKGEVRLVPGGRLLDCFSRREPGRRVRHVYAARQRDGSSLA